MKKILLSVLFFTSLNSYAAFECQSMDGTGKFTKYQYYKNVTYYYKVCLEESETRYPDTIFRFYTNNNSGDLYIYFQNGKIITVKD